VVAIAKANAVAVNGKGKTGTGAKKTTEIDKTRTVFKGGHNDM